MKIFGIEFKFNGYDIWHSGNFSPDDHINNKTNPHAVTKSQIGLGSVYNYGLATQAEAEAGTSSSKYMTPLRTKQAIDKSTPTKLSQFTNDVGFTSNALIQTVSNIVPSSPVSGQVWIQTY